MHRLWILGIIMACPTLALAQTSPGTPAKDYRPAVPAPTTVQPYGGWNGYSTGGGTAAGNALGGLASVISAQGDYNLATSAAAVNMTQADRNNIQNRQLWTNTYFEMRRVNRAARAAERAPAPTPEQIARMAKEGVPKPIRTKDLDPVTGRIAWPPALQQEKFAAERGDVDQLFASRAKYGVLTYDDQLKAREAIEVMFNTLKEQIQQMPPADYVACRGFLQSLEHAATKSDIQ